MQSRNPSELARIRDNLAPHYDAIFGPGSPGAEGPGSRFMTEALNKFGPGSWIVHIGCGNGHETLAFAKQGVKVWAIDWSPEMIQRTNALMKKEGVDHLVTALVMAPRDVAALLNHGVTEERLDGAFMPWGVLNQEADLSALFAGLYKILRPSAIVIAGLLGSRSLFGAASEVKRGNLRAGLKRLRGRGEKEGMWHLGEQTDPLPIAYPTFEELTEINGSRFLIERREPVGLLTLPPREGKGMKRGKKGLMPRLGRLEKMLAPLPFAQAMADQSLMIIRRTVEGVWGPAGPHYLAN